MNGIDLLAEYVFLSKYSQRKEDGILENWGETIDRIYKMHKYKLNTLNIITDCNDIVDSMIEKAVEFERSKKMLSSQRGRQFASISPTSGILKHESKIYNCCSTYIDRVDVFGELMYLLLSGCGVGYSLHKAYVDKLPEVMVKSPNAPDSYPYLIEDSIEGWADSIKVLMNEIFYGSCDIYTHIFDYSSIRPEGALIDNKFTAPGPEPLKRCHERIIEIARNAQGRKFNTLELHDIVCHIADSVVSGGVRRSAMIALFDKDDDLMLTAKTGNWWQQNPQRAMANNSILCELKNSLSYDELKEKLKIVRQFGEPGFVNVSDFKYVVNPCCEIVMNPSIDGETGFAFCNLVEINAERVKTEEEFYEVCEVASFVATLQSLYTDFKYLSPASRKIAERDRAIGVSITGIYANPILREEVLREGAKKTYETNNLWSRMFNINPSRTCTTIKPSGNASSILGLYCSGIHPAHDRKYLRRVRIKTYSTEFNALKDTPMVKILRGDEAVISFPIESTDEQLVIKDEVSAIEHLKFIAMVKHYWINKGCMVPKSVPNNISATVEVCEDEWDEVASALFINDHLFTGVSLLPKLGDQIYDNAPFQRLSSTEVTKEFDDIKEYLENNEVDFIKIMSQRDDMFSGDLVAVGCSGGACELR